MKPLTLSLMLLDWSEGKRGRRVVFEVLEDPDDPSETHPFKDFTSKNGRVAGQVFAGVFVEYDPGTGKPVEQATVPVPTDKKAVVYNAIADQRPEWVQESKPFAEMLLSQQAAILCKDIQFQAWMVNENGWPNAGTEAGCREAICTPMGLSSRSQLDSNKMAAAVFTEWLVEFAAWRQKQGAVKLTAGDSW